MPYVCENCNNKTEFLEYGTQYGTCNISRGCTTRLNEDGEETDFDSGDDTNYGETNWDDIEGDGYIECAHCGNDAVQVSQEEWEEHGEEEQPKIGKLDILKQTMIGGEQGGIKR